MNIGQIKLLSWLAAGLLTAGLAFYVYTFVKGFPGLQKPVDTKKIDEVLQQGEPVQTKTDEITSYEDIRRLILPMCERDKKDPNCKHFNWTGRMVVVEAPVDPTTVVKAPEKPVRDLLVVQMTASSADPATSLVSIRYKPEAQVTTKSPTNCFTKKVGDHLHTPLQYIVVDAITDDGVVFAFEDAKRPKETIGPKEFDAKTSIMLVDEKGVIMPKLQSSIVKGATQAWNPERTSPLGNNAYKIGTEDAKEFEKDYDRILAVELRPERHKDPRTGKYDGIELGTVAPGSIAERHGAQTGDVIKSINGQPVTSPAEAIQFVKNHKDEYSTWEVVVENKGRQRTLTYHSPQH